MKPGRNGNYPPNTKGYKFSEEARARMSEAKRKFWSENSARAVELREEVRNKRLGSSWSPETKSKIKSTLSGRAFTEEHKSNLSAAKTGSKFSEEHKANIAAARKAHAELELPDCKCIHHHKFAKPTNIEILLREVILAEFPEVVPYKKFGRYEVDAYLPTPYHLAFEADGDFWHAKSQVRDAKRDAYLLDKFDLPVIRIWQHEILEVCYE